MLFLFMATLLLCYHNSSYMLDLCKSKLLMVRPWAYISIVSDGNPLFCEHLILLEPTLNDYLNTSTHIKRA